MWSFSNATPLLYKQISLPEFSFHYLLGVGLTNDTAGTSQFLNLLFVFHTELLQLMVGQGDLQAQRMSRPETWKLHVWYLLSAHLHRRHTLFNFSYTVWKKFRLTCDHRRASADSCIACLAYHSTSISLALHYEHEIRLKGHDHKVKVCLKSQPQ